MPRSTRGNAPAGSLLMGLAFQAERMGRLGRSFSQDPVDDVDAVQEDVHSANNLKADVADIPEGGNEHAEDSADSTSQNTDETSAEDEENQDSSQQDAEGDKATQAETEAATQDDHDAETQEEVDTPVEETTQGLKKKKCLKTKRKVQRETLLVTCAGSDIVNGEYTRVHRLPRGASEKTTNSFGIYQHDGVEWLYILHTSGDWWIGDFRGGRVDFYTATTEEADPTSVVAWSVCSAHKYKSGRGKLPIPKIAMADE